jgi:hypothetical protein
MDDCTQSEAIGALARIAYDIEQRRLQLRQLSKSLEATYRNSVEAFWSESEVVNHQAFQEVAITYFTQAHTLMLESERLRQRYKLCLLGIDRLNEASVSGSQ